MSQSATPVTLELLLENARAIRDLRSAAEKIAVGDNDSDGKPIVVELTRAELLFRYLPQILDPRRIVALCDQVCERPEWYRVNRDHLFCPELSIGDLAEIHHLKRHTVRDFIRRVEIGQDCYRNIPNI